ncbi:molybdopterin cofactor-binding domain-containing protein [Kaarinaea lacus]
MQKNPVINVSRRRFLVSTATVGAGLTLGVYLPGCGRKPETPIEQSTVIEQETAAPAIDLEFNAFVRVSANNEVTIVIKHLEMGQGTYTGLATIVADEMDADWEQIEVESAPANAQLYKNLFWGAQGTGGSTAIANSFTQMRKAGASAKYMLVSAAAKKWNVPMEEITVERGIVQHTPSENQASFGELAELAAKESVPEEVFLKDPEEFRLIGTLLSRKDSMDKVYATGVFTQDVKLPNMLTALVAHPPLYGAIVKSFDDTKTKAVKGVTDVVQIPNGVAVLAKDFWSAKKGRDVLQVEWDESNAFNLSSAELMAKYKETAMQAGAVARNDGDATGALKSAAKTVTASYEFPYLAHASMEPLNCVVQITDQGCEIWNGCQSQTADQFAVANTLGIKPEQVKINTLYAGGSFGRRANPHQDYVVEATTIAKAINGKAPVKMVWTREDDTRAGYYRPMYYHEIKAGLDKEGNPIAWHHRIVGQSIMTGTANEAGMVKNGVDISSVEGAENLPYAISNMYVDLHSPKVPVPVQWWRSVGSTHTAFSTETFVDELAVAAGKDPLEFRRALLKDQPRHLGVLNLAAEKAGWGNSLGNNRGRGIAVHKSFNTYVAQVAEVTVHDDKSFTVDRVVIAVDSGISINPDIVRAQMEGGMGYGLAAAISSEITLDQGKVQQSNFHDYTVLRINHMPMQVEVHIVKSDQPPTGVGEPGTPVIAPAVANALFQATGKRFYKLPMKLAV